MTDVLRAHTILRDLDRYGYKPIGQVRRQPGDEFPPIVLVPDSTCEQAEKLANAMSWHYDAGLDQLFYVDEHDDGGACK